MGVKTTITCDIDDAAIDPADGFERFGTGKRELIICNTHWVSDPAGVKALISGDTDDFVDEKKAKKDAEAAAIVAAEAAKAAAEAAAAAAAEE